MDRSNILWIVTTQWRAQACGYAGDPNARTPHLDALAVESVNFTQAVTPHPFGPFARAAMLTGVLSPENGVRDYFDPLPIGARTIAHELGARDYATAFFGKWHLWKRDPAAPMVGEAHAKIVVPPEARGGFAFWEGFESGFLLNDPWLHGSQLARPEKFSGYQADVVCGRAAEWIAENQKSEARRPEAGGRSPESRVQRAEAGVQSPEVRDQRAEGCGQRPEGGRWVADSTKNRNSKNWFAVVSLESPHPPYGAPASGFTARDGSEIVLRANVPRGGEVEARARRELAGYYAHIEATDRAIGKLLAGVARETLVVFTSVHGDMHGAHGLFRKGWPHEESVRVPLLVRKKEKESGARSQEPKVRRQRSHNRGERRETAVSLVDLPELMLAEVENREPRFRNQFSDISMPSVVRRPHQCDRVWRGVRTARRKLVLSEGSPWFFFDLENDPLELRNLAHESAWAEEIAELRALAG